MNAPNNGNTGAAKPVTGQDGAAMLRRAMKRAAGGGATAADSSAEVAEIINTYQATLLRMTGSSLLEAEDVTRIAGIIAFHGEVEERATSRRLRNRGREVREAIDGIEGKPGIDSSEADR